MAEPSLRDPIIVACTTKQVRFDEDGECILTLRLPATEVAKAARFALLREIVFSAVFTPIDVADSGEPKA